MAPAGTQSPSSEKPDPLVPGGGKQMTQADQRPEASGQNPGPAPGEQSSGGVSAEALKTAQQSATAVEAESRKDVETA
ncbi:hypothetical protein V866_001334 [Kwoniella sp. B9012]|uniref:Uncharacterized protein n=2 Tax=Kwoniella TaxID=490731 RepID=A0A1B9IZD5_9TREE|nr:uncharacterized protein I203_04061 [Kwoniella mangroviensis CBS 8507]OCF60883.1 hypothetical protein L486_00527 [Kwoniella mangroviensis CBS 10435]OCF66485.1 hypothetical protein I203_04061 [Kwoniella mangroviensis CBS 8507]OCF74367.1 hypothetical protein I204_04738 [Kwoniella mangroviensis CBS 8886]